MSAMIDSRAGFAFFDVDDTLIADKSMLSFQRFWYEHTGDEVGRAAYEADLRKHLRPDACWAFLNRLYYRHFAGRRPEEVAEVGRLWFRRMNQGPGRFYHDGPLAELRAHQRQGRQVVFVSGSFPAVLDPIAGDLGVAHILATRLAVADGRYTGEIHPPQTIGEGKARALLDFVRRQGVDPAECHAYGDDISDLPMLEQVGHPTVVTGGRALEEQARARGWRLLDLEASAAA